MSETENTTNKHLDEMKLLLYVERQLDRESAQEVSLHTQTCDRCLTLLRALDRESRLLTRSLLEQDEPLPARLAEFQEKVRTSMQWIWGVVFGMALLGIYALYAGYIEPWEQQVEQAGFNGTNLLSLLVFQGAFWKGWQSMFTLIEFVALASFAGFAFFLGRKYLKRGTALAVMFASMGLLLMTPGRAAAIESRHGEAVTVAKDEKIKGDLLLNGQRVRMEGDVDGDLIVFSQDVEIQGHVTGDVLGAGQTFRISGIVDGNVRVAANTLTVSGTVGHNLSGWAQHLALEGSGKVQKSVWAFCQLLALDGQVGGDLLAYTQSTTISGTVGGSVDGRGESLSISSSAQIDGSTKFVGEKPPDVASRAKLASPVDYTKLQHRSRMERGSGFSIWSIIWATAYLLFGLVLLSLLPQFSKEAATNVEHVGASFGLGVLVGFAVPIAAVIACVTVVGLFVGLSALFLWYASLYFAQIIVGTAVGQWILGKTNEFWPLVGRMAVGVLLLRVGMAIPYVGFWFKLGVIVWGVGALSLAMYRRLQPAMAPKIPSMPSGPVGTPLPSNTTVGSA